MDGYRTRQREVIAEYLRERGGSHVKAGEIVLYLRQQGTPVAYATVYRALDRLEKTGVVRKYIIDEKSGACWQYSQNPGCEAHFHLKCTDCGQLIHAGCDFLEELGGHILDHHDFEVDNLKTVLYGKCPLCRGREK